MEKILVHLPAYRDPELIPTIKNALLMARNPERLVFGICNQYNSDDTFGNLGEYFGNPQFKIDDIPYKEAKGLPYARQRINDMITDETYILQLDSHHRFAQDWDETLVNWHKGLELKGSKPIITGYLPLYNPKNDPAGRSMEPWQQQFACFYPHGTIFIRPAALPNWESLTEPVPSRFISGHFAFARTEWAKEIKHDPNIYFSGEEINLTVRSFTHGYDLFHPPRIVIWHSTMREERSGMLLWDDQSKRGEDWYVHQKKAWKRIRNLFRTEESWDVNLTGYDLGTVRTLHSYELYAGVCFKNKGVQKYTLNNQYPPNPPVDNWEKSLLTSFYHCINFDKSGFKHNDYDFWTVAIDDEYGIGIHRQDLNEHEVKEVMDRAGSHVGMERFFTTDKKPAKWVIWAHSKSMGWAERIEGAIP